MSDFTIAMSALYGVLLTIAAALAAKHAKREGYVSEDAADKRWVRAVYAEARPYAATRIMVNMVFWLVLLGVLTAAGYMHLHFKVLAVEGSSHLRTEKFMDYADGELWVVQFTAAVLVLFFIIVNVILARAANLRLGWLERCKGFILDDFWGIILNFGSLFMVAGWIQVFLINVHFLWMLFFSSVNIVAYALFSNVAGEDEAKCPLQKQDKADYETPIICSSTPEQP